MTSIFDGTSLRPVTGCGQRIARSTMDVLSTHPLVLMGNQIYENPYFVDPRDFIRSLARRGSWRLARDEA